jgi:hypothetical protein
MQYRIYTIYRIYRITGLSWSLLPCTLDSFLVGKVSVNFCGQKVRVDSATDPQTGAATICFK